ncbi:MAG: complement C1q domain-containing protein [Planctomycetes bacterium]|nr:complement C1q domain-containing protein [Planctomycetota bacterium]
MASQWSQPIDDFIQLHAELAKKFPIATAETLCQMSAAIYGAQARGTPAAGAAPIVVAFSAGGSRHLSEGAPAIVKYNCLVTDTAGCLHDQTTFRAPVGGVYVFLLSFVKDAHYHDGTKDDVRIRLRLNGKDLGSAWAGETEGDRSTGTYAVALSLKAGDELQTFAESDGGRTRHIFEQSWTGFRIG